MGMKEVVRKINMSMAPELKIGGYFLYRPKKGDGYPVKIISGCYLDAQYGRVSNFWSWKRVLPNGELNPKEESGYGGVEPTFTKITKESARRTAKAYEKRQGLKKKLAAAKKPYAGYNVKADAGENIGKRALEVNHSDLERTSASDRYKSICPACNFGILPVRRSEDTLKCLATDNCLWCGQTFIYKDADTFDGPAPPRKLKYDKNGIAILTVDEKIEALRTCIKDEANEDAIGHIFDLLNHVAPGYQMLDVDDGKPLKTLTALAKHFGNDPTPILEE